MNATFTGKFQRVYGDLHPVQVYQLRYSCGHSYFPHLASSADVPGLVEKAYECPNCYKGPYATYNFD